MSQKIDQDHRRFREIVRGKIKQNLRKYITQGEMIGKRGKDFVSIPWYCERSQVSIQNDSMRTISFCS